MKIYKLILLASFALFMFSCTELNSPLEDVNITVQTVEGVTLENNVITVQRNTPVKFNIAGEPDNITFFSGESGHNFDYRNRTLIDQSQIKSSVLSFDVENKYYLSANHNPHINLYSIYISETFPGLDKEDFTADCQLLNDFNEWKELIPQTELPQKPEKKSYSLDFQEYLGKNITFAINYHPKPEDDKNTGQPAVIFSNFKITNKYFNNTEGVIYPSSMGFTPVNVWSADLTNLKLDESNLKKNNGYYDGNSNLIESALWYGTVTNNTQRMWNLKNAGIGSFQIWSTEKGAGLNPSWLVSDYLVINGTTPDTGVAIKNISNRLNNYEYTYKEVGTYKAVFVLNNANYKDEDSRIITMVINVK